MSLDINTEIWVFIWFFITGVILGVLKDFIDVLIKPKRDKIMVAISDFVFWYIASLIVFYFMYEFNDGQYRFYGLLSAVLGFWIYIVCISRFIKKLICASGYVGVKIFDFIFKILLTPLLFLYKIILYFKQKLKR